MLGVWLLCEISSPSAPLMRSSHAWTHHAKWFRSFRNQLSTCSLFLWRNPPIARYTNYRQTDFCCNIYADIHSFVVDHGVLDVQPTQLWWSCWNEGALLLISVKLSLILRSSALFLVTPMHNYEEIWMFTQATACSSTAMSLCCAMTWWLYVVVLAVPSAPPTNVTIESVSSTVSNAYNASHDFQWES